MSLWSRLANVYRAGRLERELDEEIQFHLDERTRELAAAGMTPDAAAREARRRFGNALRLRDESRDIKLLPWLDSIGRDARLGARMLRKNAVLTSAAAVSLSLALGACLAAFSIVDALILRPLPVDRPTRLVYVAFASHEPQRPESETFNDPLFVRLRDSAREYVDLFAMSTQVMRPVAFHEAGGEREPVRTQYLSGDAFAQLGVTAAAGRLLARHDDVPRGAPPVAVVSHAFWLRRFGGDPAIVGRSFALDDRAFQIVGVTEPRFSGVEPGRPTDVWLPYGTYNPRAFGNPQFNWFRVFGRLKHGVSAGQAQSVLQAAFTNFRFEYAPRLFGPAASPRDVARFREAPLYVRSAANGPSPLRRQFERPLWILIAIAALVLVVAGSNVANLLLARSAAREHEMALRLSIGAGRARLIQQLLVESALLAGLACAGGLVFAAGAAPAVVGMLAAPSDPVQLDVWLDWRLAGFAVGLTFLITALVGLVPALRASSARPVTRLEPTGRSSTPAGAMRPFVAVQVAFGLVVLFVGSLLVLSFARLSSVDPGFAASDVLLVSLEPVRRGEPAQYRRALLVTLDRVHEVTGVQAASLAEFNALGRAWTHIIRLPGTSHETMETTMSPVTPTYFETMRIPVLAGRTFVRAELESPNPAAIVVNATFVSRVFGEEPAVGKTIDARFGESDAGGPHEIVGVVADAKYDLRLPSAPTIYIPFRTNGTIHARASGDVAAIASRLREAIRAANPLVRVTAITPQSTVVDRTLLRERLLALLAGFFAVVAVTLAAVGLYGVLSFAVVRRTREIGIRMALGAVHIRVIASIVREAAVASLIGVVCGLPIAVYLSRFVETLLFDVRPLEFWSLAVPLVTLLVAGLLALAVPARRVSRIDPVVALRYE